MSVERLRAVHAGHAFDPMPRRAQLHALHVPFDTLVDGGGGPGPWEAAMERALRAGERVAVIGESGHGKSSVMQFVLGPLVEGLAPLPIAIGVAPVEVVLDPAAFARHVLDRVQATASTTLPRRVSRAGITSGGPGMAAALTLPTWLGGQLELKREVAAVASQPGLTGAAAVDALVELLAVVSGADLTPVLVLDDTDKWLRTREGDPDQDLRDAFFGKTLRLVAEDLGCAAVVAVHPHYLDGTNGAGVLDTLDARISVPLLPSVVALRTVLEHRERVSLGEPEASSVWTASGAAALFQRYREHRNLRDVLLLAHASLAQAVDLEAGAIDEVHVEWAEREVRR